MTAFLFNHRKSIYYILAINLVVRAILASFTNFGIDEVYYVTYGLFPDWSFFDHPPMISVLMRITTFDMLLMDEFFIRLGALIIGTVNIYLLYRIGYLLKDRKTGIVAALLASASIYASVIVGVFILPDTPQSLFWIISLYLFIQFIHTDKSKYLYFFGIVVGFAMLSKYHGVFLWGGAGLYFLHYKWKKLFSKEFIFSVLLSIIVFSPVILWNYFNDLSSLNFHSDRVGSGSIWPNFKNFFPEFFGQLFYNNPFNVVLIVASLWYFFKNRDWAVSKPIAFLIYTGVPLSLIVLVMSMYNGTLPHWSGPGYYGLLVVASIFSTTELIRKSPKAFARYVYGGNIFILAILMLAMVQTYTGFIPLDNETQENKIGRKDPTLDLYAWDKIGEEIQVYLNEEIENKQLQENYVVLTHKWFPAAHLDFYFALPNEKPLLVLGDIKAQHIYKKINHLRGGISIGQDACFITTSLYHKEPKPELADYFKNYTKEPKVISIERAGKKALNVYIWKYKNLQKELPL
ncbi:ArnT family glycosyltransferase [Labilibacter marinus]|uniref:ArnT family glycosyltransferase n=1 Tax=Labilibacter marinus TaxID=1477105 RepID=UPI00094FA306|nr:glycosyltransferase family 39 protein [Labilibacter marinus]